MDETLRVVYRKVAAAVAAMPVSVKADIDTAFSEADYGDAPAPAAAPVVSAPVPEEAPPAMARSISGTATEAVIEPQPIPAAAPVMDAAPSSTPPGAGAATPGP